MGAFDQFKSAAWPFTYKAVLTVHRLVGGVPSDPKVIEGWLKTKTMAKDDILRQMVAEAMTERGGVMLDEAIEAVAEKSINGFKRDESGLYIEGRQVKAAIKEATNIARATDKLPSRFGTTKMGALKLAAEHVFVVEDRIYLGRQIADGVQQRFVHASGPTGPRTGIQYEEFALDVKLEFHVKTDYEFSDKEWAMIWLTGQEQGIGASRSQGFGRYTVESWERIEE